MQLYDRLEAREVISDAKRKGNRTAAKNVMVHLKPYSM